MKKEGLMEVLLMTVVVLLTLSIAFAAPVGPEEFDTVSSIRRTLSGTNGKAREALAGNVSELAMNSTTITKGWQGYYGNITGTIVLDDAINNSMYTWDYVNPEGEIYATRDTDGINWTATNVVCANISHIVSEESTLNFNLGTGQDIDGINETFNETTHPEFNVSSQGFNADSCTFTVSTYVDDAQAGATRFFNETLLYSESDAQLVYAALIASGGEDGFKTGNTQYDFQMLVAEDGHDGDVSSTNYYFYVELG